jgi:hypothetical protein
MHWHAALSLPFLSGVGARSALEDRKTARTRQAYGQDIIFLSLFKHPTARGGRGVCVKSQFMVYIRYYIIH